MNKWINFIFFRSSRSISQK